MKRTLKKILSNDYFIFVKKFRRLKYKGVMNIGSPPLYYNVYGFT